MTFQVSKRLLNIEDYHKMAAAGILPDSGIELVNGEIIEMSPIGSKHLSCVNTLMELLFENLGRKVIISIQNPIQAGDFSEPEPDIAVLKRTPKRYADKIPTAEDVLLVIEVADTSLAYDREVKLPIYAESGIPEFWLINLDQQEIEAYWQPSGNTYKYRALLRAKDIVEAQYFELKIPVDAILAP